MLARCHPDEAAREGKVVTMTGVLYLFVFVMVVVAIVYSAGLIRDRARLSKADQILSARFNGDRHVSVGIGRGALPEKVVMEAAAQHGYRLVSVNGGRIYFEKI